MWKGKNDLSFILTGYRRGKVKVKKPFSLEELKSNPLKALEIVGKKIKGENGFYVSTPYKDMTVGVSSFPDFSKKDKKEFRTTTTCYITARRNTPLETIREILKKAEIPLNLLKIEGTSLFVDDSIDEYYLIKLEQDGLLESRDLIEKMAAAKELFKEKGLLYEISELKNLTSAGVDEIDWGEDRWGRILAKVSRDLNMKIVTFPESGNYNLSVIFDRGNTFVRKKVARSHEFTSPEDFEVVSIPSNAVVMGTHGNLFVVKPLSAGENLIQALKDLKYARIKKVNKTCDVEF